MLFYCSEHMQKRESNICELDTCSFLRFSLPTNTEPCWIYPVKRLDSIQFFANKIPDLQFCFVNSERFLMIRLHKI